MELLGDPEEGRPDQEVYCLDGLEVEDRLSLEVCCPDGQVVGPCIVDAPEEDRFLSFIRFFLGH